jgi:glycosyltransferase involved in cell wall biosynthesis
MRVVYVHAVDPRIAAGGTDLRAHELCDRLRRHVDLDISAVQRAGGSWRRRGRRADGLLRRIPPRFTQVASRPAAGLIDLESYDRIILGTHFAAPLVPSELLSRCILDAHNVESAVVAQLAANHPSATRRLAYRSTLAWSRRYEERIVRRVLGVWAVSELERGVFAEFGAEHVALVPNGVSVIVSGLELVTEPVVVFVGSLEALFNAQGVDWLVRCVWPLVRAAVPHAVLRIVGRGSERFRNVEGVDARGYVDDLSEAYEGARVAVVPLMSGAGTRLKIAEALGRGVPVVTTTVGVEGYGTATRRATRVADSPSEFASACAELLSDDVLRTRVRAEGIAVAGAELTWDAAAETAARTLAEWRP